MQSMPDLGQALKAFGGLALPTETLVKIQSDYVADAMALWNRVLQPEAAPAPPPGDRRFAAGEWAANPATRFLAEMYLLNARTLLKLAQSIDGDPKTQARVRFAVLQWIDAAAPSNYLALNPDAQKKAIETHGESLMHGLVQLWNDAQRGHLSQTDESAFEVGRNVATSPGSVIFENELFQLIEYAPLTAKVYERPILFVPPCINKFYILDLQPENSLVAHALSSGHQVFLVSWRNADASVAHKTWDDYMNEGLLAAIDAVQQVSG
ncbi:MAG: class I poly(R)-hydroxyalkanoic acid synthase, partial [Caldimonas sp.]